MESCIDHGQVGSMCRGRRTGYSRVRFEGKVTGGHRRAYCLHNRITLESIAGLVVRHTCNNPRCINPEHLLLGTHQDNMDDRTAAGNNPTGEKNPRAVLTWEDVHNIRKLSAEGVKQVEIARRYNTHQGRISNIISKRIWNE